MSGSLLSSDSSLSKTGIEQASGAAFPSTLSGSDSEEHDAPFAPCWSQGKLPHAIAKKADMIITRQALTSNTWAAFHLWLHFRC